MLPDLSTSYGSLNVEQYFTFTNIYEDFNYNIKTSVYTIKLQLFISYELLPKVSSLFSQKKLILNIFFIETF